MSCNPRAFFFVSFAACALAGCSSRQESLMDVSDSQDYSTIIGKKDVLNGRLHVYWDSRKNEAFLDGTEWHVDGVTKMMTLEDGAAVRIEKVVREGDDRFFVYLPIVSFKDPRSGSITRAKVSF